MRLASRLAMTEDYNAVLQFEGLQKKQIAVLQLGNHEKKSHFLNLAAMHLNYLRTEDSHLVAESTPLERASSAGSEESATGPLSDNSRMISTEVLSLSLSLYSHVLKTGLL